LPEKGIPIQIPSGFFFQLLDTGVITRFPVGDVPPVSPETDRLIDLASPDDERQAIKRLEKVMAYLQGEKERYADVPPRTLHRWVARFREAEEQLGSGYAGLLPRKAAQGNREPKAPSAPRELMDTFITEQFETPRHLSPASVYGGRVLTDRETTLAYLCSKMCLFLPVFSIFLRLRSRTNQQCSLVEAEVTARIHAQYVLRVASHIIHT
jgi:putative transposase